jgi:hypothetical protein
MNLFQKKAGLVKFNNPALTLNGTIYTSNKIEEDRDKNAKICRNTFTSVTDYVNVKIF